MDGFNWTEVAQNRSGGRIYVNVIINIASYVKTFFNRLNKYDFLEEDFSSVELVNTR